MTVITAPSPTPTPTPAVPDGEKSDRAAGLSRAALRWIVGLGAAVVLFGLLMAFKGANPFDAYQSMWNTVRTELSLQTVLVRGTPLILAALAVAVPARAGLVNVGGEGQLVLGGIGAAGTSIFLDGRLPGAVTLVLMCVGGALCGALWSAIAVGLKVFAGISEAVTTLLMNYVAINLLGFLTFFSWKESSDTGSGQPGTKAIPVGERLSLLGWGKVHAGIWIAVAATGLLWWALRSTRWGFQLRVVGGNPEAARRAGLKVGLLLLSAMAVGGALAGLGGVAQFAGAEFKLKPNFLLLYGYIGFLASWLARHQPIKVAFSALLLAAISISGTSLQLDSKLPAATVNILMALVLLAVFGFSASRKAANA
jgi:simple sugar transport system permease protein